VNIIVLLLRYNIIGGGVDYNSGPYTVTFPAGQTNAIFNVIITDDSILERNEIFNLTIDSDTLPNRVTVDSLYEATVTIRDNDGKL